MEREHIIKALECCSADDCDNCPNTFGNCYANLAGYALALIRELTEENERLRKTSEDGAECPSCHGTGKIGTTNWLTKHLSKEQIAKEKAEAVAEFHRELRADTVRKMQERFNQVFGGMDATNALLRRTFDQIAKEMLEEQK